jgi:hypothetical protein
MMAGVGDSSGPKKGLLSGNWAFSTMLLVGGALFSFGIDTENLSTLRDANAEINLLLNGPNKAFMSYCKSRIDKWAAGHRDNEPYEFVHLRYWAKNAIGKNYKTYRVYNCQFPDILAKNLDDALNDIYASRFGYFEPNDDVWEHLLEKMGDPAGAKEDIYREIGEKLPNSKMYYYSGALVDLKYRQMARQIISGESINIIKLRYIDQRWSVENPLMRQRNRRSEELDRCGNSDVFSSIDLPDTLLSIEIEIGRVIYCIDGLDYRTRTYYSGMYLDPIAEYFREKLFEDGLYSHRDWNINDRHGIFPALRSRLDEIGSLKLFDARYRLRRELDEFVPAVTIFGDSLRLIDFSVLAVITFVSCTGIFIWATRQLGEFAVPAVVRDLPGPFPTIAVAIVFVVLPAAGIYKACYEFRFIVPMSIQLGALGASLWASASTAAIWASRR